jgi:hypothetical protein
MRFIEKRRLKKEDRNKKMLDVYGIDDMSDDDFLDKRKSLLVKSVLRIVLGVLGICGVIVVLAIFWKDIFYR